MAGDRACLPRHDRYEQNISAHTRRSTASLCLDASAWLLPGGFFLGGLFVYPPDPGPGIVLVPIGGLLLFAGIALVARQT